MNLGHRRSASTATDAINTSNLHAPQQTNNRLRTRSDASLSPHRYRNHHSSRRKEGGDTENSGSGSEMTSSDDMELEDLLDSEDEGLEDDEETGLTSGDRRKRRKRKRRNTLLDQRVVPGGGRRRGSRERRESNAAGLGGGGGMGGSGLGVTKEEEEKLAKATFWWKVVVNTTLIAMWYLFSISITLYNKWMFKSEDPSGQPDIVFPFPLFTTCVHMIVQFSLASLILFFFPSFRPRHDSVNPHAPASHLAHRRSRSRSLSPQDSGKPIMTRWFYLTRIGPCGAATGLDIGLGNMSLKFITMTFYTMCKSSVLGFVLLFAFLFRLETPSLQLSLIITFMTCGVLLMVAGETAFDPLGFVLVMTAAASSGFRWSLTQILLIRNPATSNPFATLFFLAPVMFGTLLVLAVPVEGVPSVVEAFTAMAASKGYLLSSGILLFPGVLAFCMTSSEFALLQRTSVVTLSICGIFKEVLTIAAGTLVFKDTITFVNLIGVSITIVTIGVYNWIKIRKMKEESERDARIAALGNEGPGTGCGPNGYAAVRSEEEREVRFTEEATRRRSGSDTIRPGRGSLGDVIRASLSLGTRNNEPSPSTRSPVKKPENLE